MARGPHLYGPRTAADGGGTPGWEALEVLGEDQVVLECVDEAIDLVLHVRVHEALEIAHERLGAAVELLVEALDEVLLVDPGARPFAVREAERDLPMGRAVLLPLDRIDELGAAASAQMEILHLVVLQRRRELGVSTALLL